MIRHKRELKAFISHLAAAEVEVSMTALYVKWLRQYARYTQMSIGVDQPLSLSCFSKNYYFLRAKKNKNLDWLDIFISDNFSLIILILTILTISIQHCQIKFAISQEPDETKQSKTNKRFKNQRNILSY
ncbi:hypothetical protein BpHYR1_028614 [Brachionus plicatilis]|uniref:Uncharacterized protein n=1 Tax=Brachionus plicatilis TaxID=10195 RepID=A0A3M7SEU6_BRAPC|nr:hypothetical protein BpHYR1_028614 [Brachionus plicatilis]